MNLNPEIMNEKAREAEKVIFSYLPKEEGFASRLAEAMNYSMRAPGKRLRPILLSETAELFGGAKEKGPFMAGIEMIHTHSLIHDDLPALDNDDLRRGRQTTHRRYGEALAILSGDALLNYAYETMLLAFSESGHPDRVVKALAVMAEKTGIRGMLGGQSVDVENDGKLLSPETLDYIYKNKTSALIEAAMMTGAILAGALPEEVKAVELAAEKIGLAFQMRDDILDVVSSVGVLGKPIHSDEKNQKTTCVSTLGLAGAEAKVASLSLEAVSALSQMGKDSSFLAGLIQWLALRDH